MRAARKAGRSHNPLDQLSGAVLRRVREDTIPFVLQFDRERLDAVLDAWVTQTGKDLVDGGLRFEGTTVVEIAPKSGIGIQREEARRQVLAALSRGESDAGTVSIGPTTPAVDEADVRRVARRARAVLAAPVTVSVGMTPLVLTPPQVAATLSADVVDARLVLHSDAAKLRAQYGPPLLLLEVAPRDATFNTNGNAVSIVPAVVGKLVNLEAVGREIASGNHSFAAALVDTQPARTTESAQKLNITELVGSFTTAFPPGQPRVKNIQKASSVINGTIIPPGATFSLNNALGPRTLDKGYVEAPAIGADLSLEPAVGGGVSQVSTTLYNAAFFGCYQDVTHTVHALYITRYPMGREATLNYPSIDNQFRNDSSSGILIRSFAGSTSITVAFYGNKGGRSCRAEGPHILQTIPSETEYVDDPSLPAGQTKTLESGHTGLRRRELPHHQRPGPARQARAVRRALLRDEDQDRSGHRRRARRHRRPRRHHPAPTGLMPARRRHRPGRGRRLRTHDRGPAVPSRRLGERARRSEGSRRTPAAVPARSSSSTRSTSPTTSSTTWPSSSRSTRSRSTTCATPTSAPSSSATATTGTSRCTRSRSRAITSWSRRSTSCSARTGSSRSASRSTAASRFDLTEVKRRFERIRLECENDDLGCALWALLDVIVDGYFSVTDLVDDRLDDIEEIVFGTERHDAIPQEVFTLRRSLVQFRRAAARCAR